MSNNPETQQQQCGEEGKSKQYYLVNLAEAYEWGEGWEVRADHRPSNARLKNIAFIP